jgi:hypothetical protein
MNSGFEMKARTGGAGATQVERKRKPRETLKVFDAELSEQDIETVKNRLEEAEASGELRLSDFC